MKRVAEIIYIVESERDTFLNNAINLNDEEKKILWLCGVRKQQYFALNDLIFMTFEYDGNDFANDMDKMAKYLDSKGVLVRARRKDVPVDKRAVTNWWAPVKKIGAILEEPIYIDDNDWEISGSDILNGYTGSSSEYSDIAFDEEDWVDDIHI